MSAAAPGNAAVGDNGLRRERLPTSFYARFGLDAGQSDAEAVTAAATGGAAGVLALDDATAAALHDGVRALRRCLDSALALATSAAGAAAAAVTAAAPLAFDRAPAATTALSSWSETRASGSVPRLLGPDVAADTDAEDTTAAAGGGAEGVHLGANALAFLPDWASALVHEAALALWNAARPLVAAAAPGRYAPGTAAASAAAVTPALRAAGEALAAVQSPLYALRALLHAATAAADAQQGLYAHAAAQLRRACALDWGAPALVLPEPVAPREPVAAPTHGASARGAQSSRRHTSSSSAPAKDAAATAAAAAASVGAPPLDGAAGAAALHTGPRAALAGTVRVWDALLQPQLRAAALRHGLASGEASTLTWPHERALLLLEQAKDAPIAATRWQLVERASELLTAAVRRATDLLAQQSAGRRSRRGSLASGAAAAALTAAASAAAAESVEDASPGGERETAWRALALRPWTGTAASPIPVARAWLDIATTALAAATGAPTDGRATGAALALARAALAHVLPRPLSVSRADAAQTLPQLLAPDADFVPLGTALDGESSGSDSEAEADTAAAAGGDWGVAAATDARVLSAGTGRAAALLRLHALLLDAELATATENAKTSTSTSATSRGGAPPRPLALTGGGAQPAAAAAAAAAPAATAATAASTVSASTHLWSEPVAGSQDAPRALSGLAAGTRLWRWLDPVSGVFRAQPLLRAAARRPPAVAVALRDLDAAAAAAAVPARAATASQVGALAAAVETAALGIVSGQTWAPATALAAVLNAHAPALTFFLAAHERAMRAAHRADPAPAPAVESTPAAATPATTHAPVARRAPNAGLGGRMGGSSAAHAAAQAAAAAAAAAGANAPSAAALAAASLPLSAAECPAPSVVWTLRALLAATLSVLPSAAAGAGAVSEVRVCLRVLCLAARVLAAAAEAAGKHAEAAAVCAAVLALPQLEAATARESGVAAAASAGVLVGAGEDLGGAVSVLELARLQAALVPVWTRAVVVLLAASMASTVVGGALPTGATLPPGSPSATSAAAAASTAAAAAAATAADGAALLFPAGALLPQFPFPPRAALAGAAIAELLQLPAALLPVPQKAVLLRSALAITAAAGAAAGEHEAAARRVWAVQAPTLLQLGGQPAELARVVTSGATQWFAIASSDALNALLATAAAGAGFGAAPVADKDPRAAAAARARGVNRGSVRGAVLPAAGEAVATGRAAWTPLLCNSANDGLAAPSALPLFESVASSQTAPLPSSVAAAAIAEAEAAVWVPVARAAAALGLLDVAQAAAYKVACICSVVVASAAEDATRRGPGPLTAAVPEDLRPAAVTGPGTAPPAFAAYFGGAAQSPAPAAAAVTARTLVLGAEAQIVLALMSAAAAAAAESASPRSVAVARAAASDALATAAVLSIRVLTATSPATAASAAACVTSPLLFTLDVQLPALLASSAAPATVRAAQGKAALAAAALALGLSASAPAAVASAVATRLSGAGAVRAAAARALERIAAAWARGVARTGSGPGWAARALRTLDGRPRIVPSAALVSAAADAVGAAEAVEPRDAVTFSSAVQLLNALERAVPAAGSVAAADTAANAAARALAEPLICVLEGLGLRGCHRAGLELTGRALASSGTTPAAGGGNGSSGGGGESGVLPASALPRVWAHRALCMARLGHDVDALAPQVARAAAAGEAAAAANPSGAGADASLFSAAGAALCSTHTVAAAHALPPAALQAARLSRFWAALADADSAADAEEPPVASDGDGTGSSRDQFRFYSSALAALVPEAAAGETDAALAAELRDNTTFSLLRIPVLVALARWLRDRGFGAAHCSRPLDEALRVVAAAESLNAQFIMHFGSARAAAIDAAASAASAETARRRREALLLLNTSSALTAAAGSLDAPVAHPPQSFAVAALRGQRAGVTVSAAPGVGLAGSHLADALRAVCTRRELVALGAPAAAEGAVSGTLAGDESAFAVLGARYAEELLLWLLAESAALVTARHNVPVEVPVPTGASSWLGFDVALFVTPSETGAEPSAAAAAMPALLASVIRLHVPSAPTLVGEMFALAEALTASPQTSAAAAGPLQLAALIARVCGTAPAVALAHLRLSQLAAEELIAPAAAAAAVALHNARAEPHLSFVPPAVAAAAHAVFASEADPTVATDAADSDAYARALSGAMRPLALPQLWVSVAAHLVRVGRLGPARAVLLEARALAAPLLARAAVTGSAAESSEATTAAMSLSTARRAQVGPALAAAVWHLESRVAALEGAPLLAVRLDAAARRAADCAAVAVRFTAAGRAGTLVSAAAVDAALPGVTLHELWAWSMELHARVGTLARMPPQLALRLRLPAGADAAPMPSADASDASRAAAVVPPVMDSLSTALSLLQTRAAETGCAPSAAVPTAAAVARHAAYLQRLLATARAASFALDASARCAATAPGADVLTSAAPMLVRAAAASSRSDVLLSTLAPTDVGAATAAGASAGAAAFTWALYPGADADASSSSDEDDDDADDQSRARSKVVAGRSAAGTGSPASRSPRLPVAAPRPPRPRGGVSALLFTQTLAQALGDILPCLPALAASAEALEACGELSEAALTLRLQGFLAARVYVLARGRGAVVLPHSAYASAATAATAVAAAGDESAVTNVADVPPTAAGYAALSRAVGGP